MISATRSSTRSRLLVSFFLATLLTSMTCACILQSARHNGDSSPRVIARNTSPAPISPPPLPRLAHNPAGPNITIDSPVNNSYVTGTDGSVPILINVTTAGAGGPSVAHMDRVARIMLNGTWHDMLDSSDGNFSYFLFMSDYSSNHSDNVVLQFNVTNNNSISNYFYLNFTVDNVPPAFTVNVPQPSAIKTTDFTLAVTASDALSGMNTTTVEIAKAFPPFTNWKKINLTWNPGTGKWEYPWEIVTNQWDTGPYDLKFKMTDNAGVDVEHTVRMIVDYTPATMALVSPLNGSILSSTHAVYLRVQDPVSGIRNVTLQVNNATGPATQINASSPDIYSFDVVSTLFPDAPVEFYVRGQNDGLLWNSTQLHYTVDNTPPTGYLTGNFSQVTGTYKFLTTVQDASGLSRIAWRIDGNTFHELPIAAVQNLTINSPRYTEGNHTLTLWLEDNALPANTWSVTYNITIDNVGPNVAVRNLHDGASVPDDYVVIIDVFEDTEVDVYYALNDEPLRRLTKDNATNTWLLPVSNLNVSRGTFFLRLVGVDSVGNQDEDVYLFSVYPAPQGWPWWLWLLIIAAIAAVVVVMAILIYKKKSARKALLAPQKTPPQKKPSQTKKSTSKK